MKRPIDEIVFDRGLFYLKEYLPTEYEDDPPCYVLREVDQSKYYQIDGRIYERRDND